MQKLEKKKKHNLSYSSYMGSDGQSSIGFVQKYLIAN